MDACRTAAVFEKFKLNLFPEEWVKACWDNEFSDLNTLTAEELLTENNHFIDQLREAEEVLIAWLDSNNQNKNGEGFWSVLVESEISHKSLVTLLAYLTHNGGKMSASFAERASSILSACVYLKLIALPGSSAFKIYNSELFLQACRLLSKWNKSDGGNKSKRKRSSNSPRASQRSVPGKRGKRQKRCSDSSLESADGDKSDELEIGAEFSEVELEELDYLMTCLIKTVLVICETYSLRQSEFTATQLLCVLVGLTRINHGLITEDMGQWNGRKCSAGILAYKAIFLLCQPFHGHVAAMTNEACKLLQNHLLMLEDGKQFQNLDTSVVLLRNQALKFIRYLLSQFGERCTLCVKTLIQHMCFKVPDRAEYRTQTAQAVSELLESMPDLEFAKLLEWLKKLSKQNKVGQRSFTVEVLLVLLDKPERTLSAAVPKELMDFASHKSMLCTMLSRCSDNNASVRSRALVGFSSCINSKHSDIVNTIKEIITPVAARGRPTAKHFMPTPQLAIRPDTAENGNDSPSNREAVDVASNQVKGHSKVRSLPEDSVEECSESSTRSLKQFVAADTSFGNIELTPGFNPYLPDTEGVLSMFRRRALDTKVVVRKSALQALQHIIQFEAPLYQTQDLLVLQERCADPALSVRKQAVQSLFELLLVFPRDKQIQKAWVFGMLPQVMDRETSVQEKCFDLLEEIILQNLKPVGKTADASIEWELLDIIADENCEKLRRYLQKACQYWYRAKKLKPAMIEAVQSHVNGPNDHTAWMLLAEFAKTPVKIKHESVIDNWKTLVNSDLDDAACAKWSNVLSVLGTTAKSISVEAVRHILDDLKHRLRQFSYPPPLIAGIVNCFSKLHGCLAEKCSQRELQAWGEDLMADCDGYISNVVLNAHCDTVDEEELIRYMFTLGEVCQRCPTRMPKRAALLIQSIIASPCIGSISNCGDNGTQVKENELHGQLEHGERSHDSQGSQPSSKEMSHDSQDEDLHTSHTQAAASSQASQASQPLSQFRGSKMSSKLRAHAFITLGKLCLADESLAKKSIAALARELEESDSPAVRNNVVIIMGDLTIRYTTLVDRYVTNIAACLKDSAPLVRKNTLTILTRLLQEEYVKWKGVLFFRYITTILDEAAEIKNLAEFCLEHLLLKKHPNMFFHPFLECIFHFNNYQTHAVYNKFKQTDREKQKFSLAGASNIRRRVQLYSFMLEHMTDEQRFKTTDKINKEILSAVVDQVLPLDDAGSQILHDALAILSSKEIKLSTQRSKGVEDAGEEVADMAQVVTATAKKVLISQVIKRNVIENIVPVVISLKYMLEKSRSPLLKSLMGYLRELLKDYKNEVKDILAADRQLAKEIEFDLRKFETQEAEQSDRPRAGTPTSFHASTPPGSRPASRPPSRVPSPAVNLNPVLRETTDMINKEPGRSSPVASTSPISKRTSLTIGEAAKKALSRVEQLKQEIRTAPSRKSIDRTDSSSHLQKSPAKQNGRSTVDSQVVSPAMQGQEIRAISTPADGMYNITFVADANVTMIPPSPIPSVASAQSNGKLCLSPKITLVKKGSKTVIHMPHPDDRDTKPAMWNIQSPNAKNRKSQASTHGSDTPSRKSQMVSRAGLQRNARRKNT